jgi:hypothetical protein
MRGFQGFWTSKIVVTISSSSQISLLLFLLGQNLIQPSRRCCEQIKNVSDLRNFSSFFFFFFFKCLFCAYVEANTMKLNKGKLRKFAQSGEVVAALTSLKHKKVDEGLSKQVEQSSSRPPVRDTVPLVKTVPPVIMVDVDPSLLTDLSEVRDAIINQSPHVVMSKAKNVVSPRDMDDYFTVHTKNVHYLLIHSLMRVRVFLVFVLLVSLCLVSLLCFCRV